MHATYSYISSYHPGGFTLLIWDCMILVLRKNKLNKSFVEHNIVIIIFVTPMIVHFDFHLSMIRYYVLISLPVLVKICSYIDQVSPSSNKSNPRIFIVIYLRHFHPHI